MQLETVMAKKEAVRGKGSVVVTEQEFTGLWVTESEEVADMFYPKGHPRRGEYLRDQGVLHTRLLTALKDRGVIR